MNGWSNRSVRSNTYASVWATTRALLFGSAQPDFRRLDVPVAEFRPDEVAQLASGLPEEVVAEEIGDLRRDPIAAG